MKTAIIVGQNMPDSTSDQIVTMHDRIVIFEPLREAAAELRLRYSSQPKVLVIEAACGREFAAKEFNIYNKDGLSSSLGKITQQARDKWTQYDLTKKETTIVSVVNLREILRILAIREIDCLVIDAQGMDFAILQSVHWLIAAGAIKYIQLEADGPGFQHYTGTPDNSEASILAFMAQFPHYTAGRLTGRAEHHPDLYFTLTQEN
jgi:FkbM family methyltransferase